MLRNTVSYWYNILRNIAIIGLLSVLVYIGIRIVISSAASDKSRYKEMLKDWLVAMCLLFFMHYFMNFTVTVIDSITEALSETTSVTETVTGETIETHTESTTNVAYTGDKLIGDVRIKLQTGDAVNRMAYTIIYIVLVIYTFIFAIMYLKRVLYMAFFTMMAPLVALMYPIDKVRDGKAQAFDMWIKEYTFNAIIQPFHLIIYYVLVGSAIDLAMGNPIYALVAIGFMMPAEKLLRKFFGFNKSETAGVLGGALGGAMIMQGINALKKGSKGSGGKKASGGSDGAQGKSNKPLNRSSNPGNSLNSLTDEAAAEIAGGSDTSTTQRKDAQLAGAEESEGREGRRLDGNVSEADRLGNDNEGDENQEKYREDLKYLEEHGYGPGDAEYDYITEKLGMGEFEDTTPEAGDTIEGASDENMDEDAEQHNDSNEEEKTHRLRAAASMAGRWTLKGVGGVGKLAVKGIGAATLGTIGVAAGLASDDYENVLKYGAAGVGAGTYMANSAINKVSKLPSNAYRVKTALENERARFEEEAYSAAQRKQINNARADRQFLNDKAAQRLYKDKFNSEWKEAMEAAIKYREYGITDNEAIIKAMKLKTKGLGDRNDKKRILIAGTASKLSMKDVEPYGARLRARGFGDAAEVMKKGIREFNDYQ